MQEQQRSRPDVPLYSKSLELAQRRVLACRDAVFGNQGCNIHAQVTEGCEEEESVDGFVEASSQKEGGEDEKNAEEGEDGSHSFCYHHRIDLVGGRFESHDGLLLAGLVMMALDNVHCGQWLAY